MPKKLHIACSTTTPKITKKNLDKIIQALPSYNITLNMLIIGMTGPKKKKELSSVKIIDEIYDLIPIVKSRNICQKFLKERMNREGGIGLILDDDLNWIANENEFTITINKLIDMKCDMAFISLDGDPPIPKEYTRASPLLDILYSISRENICKNINSYVNNIKITNNRKRFKHHDLYTFDKLDFSPKHFNLSHANWHEIIDNLNIGKTTTRQVFTPKKIIPATGRERGGATLIFQANVLKYKNLSLVSEKMVSRRSDMMMASTAHKNGFSLFSTPPLLEHERRETFDSHDINKLIGDILGVALVDNFYCESGALGFKNIFINRRNATTSVIKETSAMLILLQSYFKNNGIDKSLIFKINKILLENNDAINSLNNIKADKLMSDFFAFKTKHITQI